MSAPVAGAPTREQRRRRQRRAAVRRWAIRIVAAGVVFALGIALGQALQDNPQPGPPQTVVRTLRPLPLAPATVTVTAAR
jgi:hypothetical protein